jgi:hypothetical protein
MTAAAKSRIYLAIVAMLLLVIAAIAYKFIVVGSTEKADDGRVAIILEPGERALMLREMRDFVAGLQLISEALSRDDMRGVAKAAREMGTARTHDVPIAMMGKLPLEFKTLAFSVHREFDTMAMDAEGIGTPKRTLAQLSDVLQKCVACHGSYQVKATAAKQPPRILP